MLAGVRVEHEIDERALQFRAHAPVKGKARAGDFGRPLEIQDAQLRTEIPMCFGLEIELRRIAYAPHFQVVMLIFAYRHGLVRHVGNSGKEFLELRVDGVPLLIERGNLDLHVALLLLEDRGVRAGFPQLADFEGIGVIAGSQLLRFGDGRAPPLVQFPVAIQIGRITAGLQPLRDAVEIRSKPCQIVHLSMLASADANYIA